MQLSCIDVFTFQTLPRLVWIYCIRFVDLIDGHSGRLLRRLLQHGLGRVFGRGGGGDGGLRLAQGCLAGVRPRDGIDRLIVHLGISRRCTFVTDGRRMRLVGRAGVNVG